MVWIPFKKTDMARNGLRPDTALIADEPEVKARLNGVRNTKDNGSDEKADQNRGGHHSYD